LDLVEKYCIKLNKALGYDFNTVEFAIRDGVPYAIDFCNPAPDADINSVGQDNFDWIVENAADMAIAKAKEYKKGEMNLTWGTFVKDQIVAPKVAAKKTPTKKVTVKKAPVKKTVSEKAPAKKAPAKVVASKTVTAPKAPIKKTPAKMVVVKKALVKKAVTAKKSAKK
jgi:hypothetical protein